MEGEPASANGPVGLLLRFDFKIQPLLADQVFLLCLSVNLFGSWRLRRKAADSTAAPMSDLQYRTCQHSGEKAFAEQSRLLTYRGNTYRTRVFQAQQ